MISQSPRAPSTISPQNRPLTSTRFNSAKSTGLHKGASIQVDLLSGECTLERQSQYARQSRRECVRHLTELREA